MEVEIHNIDNDECEHTPSSMQGNRIKGDPTTGTAEDELSEARTRRELTEDHNQNWTTTGKKKGKKKNEEKWGTTQTSALSNVFLISAEPGMFYVDMLRKVKDDDPEK